MVDYFLVDTTCYLNGVDDLTYRLAVLYSIIMYYGNGHVLLPAMEISPNWVPPFRRYVQLHDVDVLTVGQLLAGDAAFSLGC